MKQVINIDKQFSSTDIIKKINNLITIEAENILFIHLRYIFKYFLDDSNEHIFGKSYSDTFNLWQFNRIWGGIFYPIIFGKLLTQDGKLILEIKVKLNICGRLFSIITFITMMIVFIYYNSYVINDNIYFKTENLFIAILICLIFQSVPLSAYYLTRNQTIKFLKHYLKSD